MSDRNSLYTDPLWADVSLSGGGHRAALWGYGTLFGILRARRRRVDGAPNLQVASIASVSGGSIANLAAIVTARDAAGS